MASAVEQFIIDDDYRCAYCCQLKNDIDDPRYLPCKHVFCYSCISSDYRQGLTLECPICRVKHIDIIIRDLPRYIIGNRTSCNVCGLIAEKWCNQCSIYLCAQHAKEHDEAFASSSIFAKHEKAVAISTGHKSMQQRGRRFCLQHTEDEISRACSACYKALCVECVSTEKCDKDKNHRVDKIPNLGKKLKEELSKFMSELYVKSTFLSDLEKRANVLLADQEKTSGEMKALVDKVTEEQIREIQEKADKIKLTIDNTFQDCTEAINKYCSDLMSSKDATDAVTRSIHDLVNLKSDLDVILEYEQTARVSAEICKSMPSELSFPIVEIKQLAKQRGAEFEISLSWQKLVTQSAQSITSDNQGKDIERPTELVHAFSSSGSSVWSVNWLPDKTIACAINDSGKIDFRDTALNMTKSHSITGEVLTVCQHGSDYLVLIHNKGPKLNLYSSDFAFQKTLISGSGLSFMAVKLNKVLVIDDSKKCVKLYTMEGAHVLDVALEPSINSAYRIAFLDENSFIASNSHSGKVLKFKLEANSKPEWICSNLNQPTGIAVDASSFIYVVSWGARTIYVLTPSGELLTQLSPPELYGSVRDISIDGNDLAIGSDMGVQYFMILY